MSQRRYFSSLFLARPGATSATFTLSNAQPGDAGAYTVVISGIAGSVTSTAANLTVSYSRLLNLSLLTTVTSSNSLFTIGTVIGGAGSSGGKPLLVRAAGPSLTQLGVVGVRPDPKLDLFSGQMVIATNDNRAGATTLSNAFPQVGAFAYASASSKDAAVYNAAMPPGAYTVQFSGGAGATGTVITELYDATPAAAFTTAPLRLINVSVLKQINAGEILTAGFVIGRNVSKQVLIRAVGPTLSTPPFNVNGAVADPRLDLFSNQTSLTAPLPWNPSKISSSPTARLPSSTSRIRAPTSTPTSPRCGKSPSANPSAWT